MNIFLDANICLDLLDTNRPTSTASVAWYLAHKDNADSSFYFSGDFITTFYYILHEKKKVPADMIIEAIDSLSMEILPSYLLHSDFILAKNAFFDGMFDDFEDLIILENAYRENSDYFLTNDQDLLHLREYKDIRIVSPDIRIA